MKRRNIEMKSMSGEFGPLVLQWIGPAIPGKNMAYIRFESDWQYRGSLSDRQAKKLMSWLMKYYGESK